MISKVLFPVDFSMVSDYAFGNCIPRFFSSGAAEKLILVNVIDVTPVDAAVLEAERERKIRLQRVARELEEMGIKTQTQVRIGSPEYEIASVAEEEDVDIIFIPSKGENIIRDIFVGTTARNVARVAKKPVLLVRYEWDRLKNSVKCYWDAKRVFEKPFVAIDFSKCSEQVLNSLKVIEDFIDETVFFHAVDYGKPEELEKNAKEAEKKLEEVSSKFKFDTKVIVEAGNAANGILHNATVERSTVILLGKRGRNRLVELLVGSTADWLISHSVIPLLIIPCKS